MRLRLLCLALLPFVSSCSWLWSVIEKPAVSLRRVDLKDINFSSLSADFVLGVHNPNALGLDLARLAYQITVDGHAFAEGLADGAVHVPARGDGETHVPVTIKFVDFARSLDALFHKRTVPYALATRLGFSTPMGVLEVPLANSGDFPVPQLPSVNVMSAGVGSTSLSGTDLKVMLGVHNSNSFAVPLGTMQYQLSVAGAPVVASVAPLGQAAANSSNPVTINAHLDFLSLGTGVLRAIQSRTANLALDGKIDLGGYATPMHLSHQL